MSPVRRFAQRHPVLSYYALVFGISWGGMMMIVAQTGIPGRPEDVEAFSCTRSRLCSQGRASPGSS
jgi:hypothetical protein